MGAKIGRGWGRGGVCDDEVIVGAGYVWIAFVMVLGLELWDVEMVVV